MKRAIQNFLTVALMAAIIGLAAQAQGPNSPDDTKVAVANTNKFEKVNAPNDTDMYCSGFIAPTELATSGFVAGALESPFATSMSDRDLIYLSGIGIQRDAMYQVLRKVKDPQMYHPFKGQPEMVAKLGVPYAEIARVQVIKINGSVAVAQVKKTCDSVNLGDVVVPFKEKQTPPFRRFMPFDPLASPNGMLTGRIVAAKEMDFILATGKKVYLNIGSNQGVKPGDYFRVTRTYDAAFSPKTSDSTDEVSYNSNVRDLTTKDPVLTTRAGISAFPRRSLGEMMVLYTTATSATAMVTLSQEAFVVGDLVEKMPEPPPLPPPPPPPPMPPTVTCNVTPNTVRMGSTATVTSQGISPDGHPLHYMFVADAGVVTQNNNTAAIAAVNMPAGLVTVLCTAIDDRDLSASTAVKFNVEIPPANPVASSAGLINFKPNSGVVDNRAKAMLDGLALRLQKETGSSVLLIGGYTGTEKETLANTRANNAKAYLTKDKGIDAARVSTAFGGYTGDNVDVRFIPAGASAPPVKPVAAPPAPVKPAVKKPVAKKPAAKPAAAAPAKPAASPTTTPAKPGATTPAKPATTTPAKPGAATPAKPGTTPDKPKL